MIKELQKWLKKNDINLDESAISMILGAIVVILVGLIAYNYFRSQTAAPSSPAEQETTEEGQIGTPAAAVALPATHVIERGDSLWSIAEKYYTSGYNYQDIAQANNIANPTEIEPGQKLTIPKVAVRLPQTVNTQIITTVTPNRIDGTSYTVVRGDDLWDIAVRAYGDGFRWVEIARVNNLANPDVIHSGNKLTIPRP